MTLETLRSKYPVFVYEKYSYRISKNDLEIFFSFSAGPDLKFRPKLIIKNIDKKRLKKIGDRVLGNFIFNLGMIESLSYWKATCSPEITVKAGPLDRAQISWWKDLIDNGMGQFFYENKIDWRAPDFLKISVSQEKDPYKVFGEKLKNRYLVPMGGGKDSIVALETLKSQKKEINCFAVNPFKAIEDVIRVGGVKKPVVVLRKIDPVILDLNKKGYLNGHTPFSALLAFLSVFCAVLFDYRNVALANEKSADEGNVMFLGKMINHQYSKSSRFEIKFRDYCKKYLATDANYYSILRKYTELDIAKMFVKYKQYFPVFSSCNAIRGSAYAKGYGVAKWCGECPKCLFSFLILYPFLKRSEMIKIFGRDLFERGDLLPLFKDLLGYGKYKPFECVGTKKESQTALRLCLAKIKGEKVIPSLLAHSIAESKKRR